MRISHLIAASILAASVAVPAQAWWGFGDGYGGGGFSFGFGGHMGSYLSGLYHPYYYGYHPYPYYGVGYPYTPYPLPVAQADTVDDK
jgi:hypothetical protein